MPTARREARRGELGGFLRWQWHRWRAGLPREPAGGYRFPVARPDLQLLTENRAVATVTWIGHSTLLWQLDGLNLITDPHFSLRASPLGFVGPRRRVPPVPTLEQLPRVDAVLISHNHYDHLDKTSVRRLAAQAGGPPRFFVPQGLRRWFERRGITDAVELAWWDEDALGGLQIHCVPARHWSARGSFDRDRSLWCGWVIRSQNLQVLFAGDTGYSEAFREIRKRLGPMDVAAIPIGHYEPRWFMQAAHVDPEEAVQIAVDVQARCAIGIHWGTFPLTDEPLDEPPKRLRVALETAGLSPHSFVVLERGATRSVEALMRLRAG
ncbi:MAG: MBL fold metallo-hydrolase [Gammaproteobacteria bacterium]|nr:MBL fold metallo-hydrolase [Gammaproteobacteria bacterium]